MSSRSSRPGKHSASIALGGLLAAVIVAVLWTATANAAEYKALLCAGNNGSNSFGSSTNSPNMTIENYCGPAGDPAGGDAFVRLTENKGSGSIGEGAYAFLHWDTPPWVHYRQAGGYTREPESFNDGWRARFWIAGGSAGDRQVFAQGAGLPNNGELWGSWPTFQPHLWHHGGYLDFTRFAFEMRCERPAGCDTSGFNATDANTFNFILSDEFASQVSLTSTGAPFMDGGWSRGQNWMAWTWTERGSGLRFERIYVDSTLRHEVVQNCDLGWSPVSGEFARQFQPCPTYESFTRGAWLDTASLSDGAHWLVACTQDYAQAQGLTGTGGQTCDGRVIRTDNMAPGAPVGLGITSANPNRYLSVFDAHFSLPDNQGSPITRVHYEIVDGAGQVVVPKRVSTGVNPTAIAGITGPRTAGFYWLRVWLEDEVGLTGPVSTVAIPHDTTPPAAPQDLSVAAPSTTRSAQGFDVRWRNIVDDGSPISAVHYQVLNGASDVVVPMQTAEVFNPTSIARLETPRERGSLYSLRLWLEDAEGNVGAPVKAPLSYDCVRSNADGGQSLSAGIGPQGQPSLLVQQGQSSTLAGKLEGTGQLGDAPLCVYSRVVTDGERQFLGLAMTGSDGSYRFPVADGPSREFSIVYRPDQRQLTATATLRTQVVPTLQLGRKVVRNKHFGVYTGMLPGPHNEGVIVVLRVKDGKHSRVFRETRTGPSGAFTMRYRYLKTRTPTTYVLEANVGTQAAYPYEGGKSRPVRQRVKP